jgi:hypothetical protein
MQVYPAKTELIELYRKMVPTEVFDLLMHLELKDKNKLVEIE